VLESFVPTGVCVCVNLCVGMCASTGTCMCVHLVPNQNHYFPFEKDVCRCAPARVYMCVCVHICVYVCMCTYSQMQIKLAQNLKFSNLVSVPDFSPWDLRVVPGNNMVLIRNPIRILEPLVLK